MNAIAVNQFFVLYMWFALVALILLMMLIARFYQNFSGEKTFFRIFIAPIILFGIASVRYTSIDKLAGDPLADLLFSAGGLVLLGLCLRLYWVMVVRRTKEEKNSLK